MTKDFESVEYWDHFSRGILLGTNRPTPEEAGGFIISLMVKFKQAKEETAAAQKETKIAKQQFQVFAMEASNNMEALVRKYS